jgi:hypothetical protein
MGVIAAAAAPNIEASIANDRAYHDARDSFEPFYRLGNKPEFLCVGRGGIWIGGEWALSCAHSYDRSLILKEYRDRYPADMVKGKSVVIATPDSEERIPIEQVYVPKKLTDADSFAYDLCLIRLAHKPRTRGLQRARISAVTDLLGKRLVVSGYGELGLGSTGKDASRFKRPHPGMRFGFENVFDKYTNRDAVARFTFDEDGLPLEGSGSSGDSGTGMFIETDGRWELAAVFAHSSTAGLQHPSGANKSVYGSSDGGVRVALFAPEIKRALETDDPGAFADLDLETMEARTRAATPSRTSKLPAKKGPL